MTGPLSPRRKDWSGLIARLRAGDLRKAVAADCWCGPTDDEGVLVHHSMDKREEFEEGRQPS